jgi:hypothetical protein
MKAGGLADYASLRSAPIEKPVMERKFLDGFLSCPGKSILKIISQILNNIGSKIPNWNSLASSRILDHLLALFVSSLPKIVLEFVTSTAYSWASRV